MFCTENWAEVEVLVHLTCFGCTNGRASVTPVVLIFLIFCWIDLELIFSSIVSSSKYCFDFFELSWTEFEQVCRISKANSNLIKLLTQEPLLIVRSRTKNYEISTKSSILYLLMTLDTRKVLNLRKWVLGTHDCFKLRGLLSHFIWDLTNHWFFL